MTLDTSQSLPFLFKGLALFTPGGDLIYCIDPDKQGHWHMQLCQALQTVLHLPETPLFLVPCYTAALDRWLHPHTQQLQVSAEAYPRVWRYRSLLDAVFSISGESWRMITAPNEICDAAVIRSYQQRFPQLWENHNLVVRLDQLSTSKYNADLVQSRNLEESGRSIGSNQSLESTTDIPQGYVLRLFVASNSRDTTSILQNLHELLDQALEMPYTLKVIDVTKHPDRAEADQITATPTLVKIWPEPVRRLVGNQLATDMVMQLLGAAEMPTQLIDTNP